jgi:putative endonuclease
MRYWVYILRSQSTERYYCGSTEDVERRLRQHNDPDYGGTKTTKRFAGPWRLVWKQEHPSRSEAMLAEKQIKNRGISRFLDDVGQLVESRRRRD